MISISIQNLNANQSAQIGALAELHRSIRVSEIGDLAIDPLLDGVDLLIDNFCSWAHHASRHQGWSEEEMKRVRERFQMLAYNLERAAARIGDEV
jgi:hypothetical protein